MDGKLSGNKREKRQGVHASVLRSRLGMLVVPVSIKYSVAAPTESSRRVGTYPGARRVSVWPARLVLERDDTENCARRRIRSVGVPSLRSCLGSLDGIIFVLGHPFSSRCSQQFVLEPIASKQGSDKVCQDSLRSAKIKQLQA